MFAALATASAADAARLTPGETSLLAAMNHARAEHGLAPLRVDLTLERAARAHSLDMLRRNYFAHGAFASRIIGSGARGPLFGENLAWGSGRYAAPATIVAEWLASPEHRANLLHPGFARVGLAAPAGTFRGGPAVVVTADFAGR